MKKILAIIFALFLPQLASAHAFGQLYNLPVPFWLYLYGSAGAIIVSFLIIGYFFNQPNQDNDYTTVKYSNLSSWVRISFEILSVLLFLLTIVTGLFGVNIDYSNFNMTFFWIIFVLGLTYFTALYGNIYEYINPWKTLSKWFGLAKLSGLFKYPKSFGYYPAFVFYFMFVYLELIGHTNPFKLSGVLVFYTLINFLGVITFGIVDWFKYGEFFSVFFRLIGKIAMVEYREGQVFFRLPFVGLLKESAEHFSLLLFILFMLSSTAFDGFRETIVWVNLYHKIGIPAYAFQTLGLLISPFFFLVIYLILIGLAKQITKTSISFKDLALAFAFTLIPIALVYNIAHYYTLMFSEAPNILRLISDPFGFGWDIFGTAKLFLRFILDASFIWHSQVGFILFGHIASVYLAHVVALKVFPTQKKAIVSQVPMLILMVLYTMIGLWILSQPITGGTL